MPTTKEHVVSVYIFRLTPKGPQYLALHRRKEIDRLGDTWQSVHGGIEEGETATQAAARELFEETGLKVIDLWSLNVVEMFYVYQSDEIVLNPAFGAQVDGEVRLGTEHDQYQWLNLQEIKEIFIWPGQRRAVQTLHDEISSRLFEQKPLNLIMKIAPEYYKNA